MITQALRRFRRDTRGSNTVEFALTALPLLLLMIGIIESGLVFWTWQAMQGTAIATARCAGINATACAHATTAPANTQSYAVTAASARGLSGLTTNNVTVTTGSAAQTACGATTATVVQVSLSYNFGSVFLVSLPSALTASACFPLLSTS